MKTTLTKAAILIWVVVMTTRLAAAQPPWAVEAIAINSNGSMIATGYSNGQIRVTQYNGGQLVREYSDPTPNPVVTDIKWSPTDPQILAFSMSSPDSISSLKVYNVSTGQLLTNIDGLGLSIDAITWNPTGYQIAGILSDIGSFKSDYLEIWQIPSGINLRSSVGLKPALTDVSWSPNGQWIAVGTTNSEITLWNASDLSLNKILLYPEQTIGSLIWSPSSTEIAVNSDGPNAGFPIYDVSSGAVVRMIGNATLAKIAWSPDGTRLAGVEPVTTSISLWNAQTGQQLDPIVTNFEVNAIVWSKDSTQIVAGSVDGTYQIVTAAAIPSRNGTGLRGQYFDASNFTVPKFFRLNASVDYNWGTLSPDAALAADTFSVRWTGKVEPLYSEAITFYVTHNDGARLWVNGQSIINNWTNTTNAVTDSGTITLAAGVKTDIVLEYYDNTGSASVKLEWQSARQTRQVIPSTQLYPPEGQLAYTARSGGVDSVMIANPDGTETVQVFGTSAAWSPDGSQVAFITSAYDGNPELYVVNADGSGSPRRLTNHTAAESEPCWSPDSTKIAFASARTGGGDIYVVTVAGTSGVPTATRLTTAVDKEYLFTRHHHQWRAGNLYDGCQWSQGHPPDHAQRLRYFALLVA